ncbi:ZIP family metal transporter [Allobranchiibius sp. CTAmp26]|uniref:ZIP family metal transporter n=1 Tax=Allobranchiibius sp. CTAmp26 TaxID=2815214 RepID=UPI001AA15E55|nr:ZIP family metal transporter [Allobranchiibius sp. CTAmp26]MBO1753908.1 ZIP family metal transporter [Allobranchiibius sp. CTAmp26]
MSLTSTLLLGFIAGVTIVIGLPLGRMRAPAPGLRVFLNATAVGVLLFLFWDVLAAAWEPIDSALGKVHDGNGSLGPVFGYGVLFAAGLSAGLLSLVAYDRYMARTAHPTGHGGPGAMAATDRSARARGVRTWPAGRRLALLIAVGIGLHNFAEGLAIGQAAASNAISLATVLVIGFALHNATEGFGIVAPLAADRRLEDPATRPSWRFLLAMAAIGGGPTFVGTAVGHTFTSEPVSVAFLTLAAGSIVYVIVQLLGVTARARRADLVAYGLLVGLLAGFVTDAIVSAGGA